MKHPNISLLLFFCLSLGSGNVYSDAPVGCVDGLNKDRIRGWAKDPDCPELPIEIRVCCYPLKGSEPNWEVKGCADNERADVGLHGIDFTNSLYTGLADGDYDIVVYAIGKDADGVEDGHDTALPLSSVGTEINATRQSIRKDTFAGGKYMVFSQYLGVLWDEPDNYDMYQSAVRTADNGTVYCYYVRSHHGVAPYESVYVRTSPNGITDWSEAVKVIACGPGPDSLYIADADVLAVPSDDGCRFWLHYTGSGIMYGQSNCVFQAVTTQDRYAQFTKQDADGDVITAVPMLRSTFNYVSGATHTDGSPSVYGAGQPSVIRLPDGRYCAYFTDANFNNEAAQVVQFSVDHPGDWFSILPDQYAENLMGGTVQYANSSHWAYYPDLSTYSCVKAYSEKVDDNDFSVRIAVSQSPDGGFGDEWGTMIFDYDNTNRNYIAEGGILRGLNGWITAPDNSTIVYYGAGRDTKDWHRFGTTGCAATKYYLYRLL